MQRKDSAEITEKDVKSYLEESPQKRSYNYSNCNKSLSNLTDCYPEKSWKTPKQSELFCKNCFTKVSKQYP